MKAQIIAFATASDILGRKPLQLELPEGSHIADLQQLLVRRFPALEPLWPKLAIAVDGELARSDQALHDGCEVALLPPVSGGEVGGDIYRGADGAASGEDRR